MDAYSLNVSCYSCPSKRIQQSCLYISCSFYFQFRVLWQYVSYNNLHQRSVLFYHKSESWHSVQDNLSEGVNTLHRRNILQLKEDAAATSFKFEGWVWLLYNLFQAFLMIAPDRSICQYVRQILAGKLFWNLCQYLINAGCN